MCISWCLLNISHLKMHGKYNVKLVLHKFYLIRMLGINDM
jgi:hypothetical protein